MAYSTCAKCGNGNRNTLLPGLRLGSVVMYAAFAAAFACAQSNSFGPLTVPGTAVIFDPDNVVSGEQLASAAGRGQLRPTPAVKAMSFAAAPGQTLILSASGRVGCCGTPEVGPNGYQGQRANITSLGSISGFESPNGLPLVGVFTDGSPSGPAPPPYNYSGGVGQSESSPLLNQVFIVGTGSIGDSEQRMFHVPASATELWLGFPDAGTFAGHPGNYADNPGIDVVYGTLSSGCDLSSNGGAISSQTLATVPGEPDSRACVGVGESVLLTTASPATWTVTSTSGTVGLTTILQPPTESFPSGKGFPTLECASASGSASIYGTQACFRAPWVFDKIVVTAKFDDGSTASKTFSSLQPTGLIFQRIQWPTKGQDYYFLNTFDAFNVAMTSVVFMTPGYVSFANILVSEHDTANPHLDPNSNVLFNVNQLKAWIISCDRDQDSSRPDMDPINPKTSPWVFVDWKGQNEKEFAHVQTKWTAGQFPLSYYQYSKGQVDAQAADGTFVNTPVYPATSAVLSVWGLPPYHNDWTFPSTQDQCIQEATMLFQPIH